MPYYNTQSGLAPTINGYPNGQQPQASPMPAMQPQAPQTIGTMTGSILGHLLRSAISPQQPGAPLQLQGAMPQTAPQAAPQGGVLSQMLAGLARQQGQNLPGQAQQQQPLGATRFVNGLNVVG